MKFYTGIGSRQTPPAILELMSKIHWTHWKSYSFGICGKPDGCPIGAENRCSLCPYLATGPLYLHGVIAKTEQI